MGNRTNSEVQATKTSLDVVKVLDEIGGGGVTEIARQLEISKSAVYKHLNTLTNRGYVAKRDGQYRISLRFLTIGTGAQRRRTLFELGKTHLENISKAFTFLSALVVFEGNSGTYLLVEGDQESRNQIYEGDKISLHATAPGKIFLAQVPEQQVDSILASSEFKEWTENTITDEDRLQAELGEIRTRGFAIDDEECKMGRRGVAAPIYGIDSRVVGALEVITDVDQITLQRLEKEIARFVNMTAQRLSKQMQIQTE